MQKPVKHQFDGLFALRGLRNEGQECADFSTICERFASVSQDAKKRRSQVEAILR
jgi:hypothetical protein